MVLIAPGPSSPTVTQHVSGTPTRDAHNNDVPSFKDQSVVALAQFPGNAIENDTPARDMVMADVVLLLNTNVAVKATDEWTLTDGNRYRVLGQPGAYSSPFTGTAVTQVNLRRIY